MSLSKSRFKFVGLSAESMLLWTALSCLLVGAACHAGEESETNIALCIGVGEYDNLPALPTAVNDAISLGKVFEATGDFHRVFVLTGIDAEGKPNKPKAVPTHDSIVNALRVIAKNVSAGGNLLLYFNGYGMMRDDKAYLLPADAPSPDSEEDIPGIPLDELVELMAQSPAATKTLILDVCHGGEELLGISGGVQPPDAGFTIFFACDGTETALADEDGTRGLFSLALAAALAGDADKNEDGAFDVDELASYVEEYIEAYCLDNLVDSVQTPQAWSGDPEHAVIVGYGVAESVTVEPGDVDETSTLDKETSGGDDDSDGKENDGGRRKRAASRRPIPKGDGEEPVEKEVDQNPLTEEQKERLLEAKSLADSGEDENAFKAYLELAEEGVREAEFRVGDAYQYGRGVGQDYKKSIEWLARAGEKGHAKAQELLASIYYFGRGVPADTEEAAKWTKLRTENKTASDDDSPEDKYEIVAMDEPGTRMPSDYGPALKFEIIRPDGAAITLGRLTASCTCVKPEMAKRSYGVGERAFVELRNVRPTPAQGNAYEFYVEITSPVVKVLRMNVFVQSDTGAAPRMTPPQQVQQPDTRRRGFWGRR